MISLQRRCKKHRQSQVFSIRAGLTFEKINPEVLFYGTSGRDFMLFGVLPDSNNIQTFKIESDNHFLKAVVALLYAFTMRIVD